MRKIIVDKNYRARVVQRLWKRVGHSLIRRPRADRRILFIVGCQRSGTTLLNRGIFTYDGRSRIYGERSVVSDNNLRLLPFSEVAACWQKIREELIVVKSLNDSQITDHLLDYFPASKAVWMIRHYRDVSHSNLEKWGSQNGINDLRPIVHEDDNDWRAERNSDQVKALVLEKFSENMNPYDAAALFWLVRNKIFLDLHLDRYPGVRLCVYEDLVVDPERIVGGIYDFLNLEFPGTHILREVHRKSAGRGRSIKLSKEIDTLCGDLWEELLVINRSQDAPDRLSQV